MFCVDHKGPFRPDIWTPQNAIELQHGFLQCTEIGPANGEDSDLGEHLGISASRLQWPCEFKLLAIFNLCFGHSSSNQP